MIVLGFAGFFNDFVMPAAWAGTMDIGGRYSGTVSGAMNMMGSIAGAVSVTVVGYLLAWTSGNWTMTFYISSAIYFLGAICWLFLDSHTPIEQRYEAVGQAAYVGVVRSPVRVGFRLRAGRQRLSGKFARAQREASSG